MAHFSKILDGFVVDLIVVGNEDCGGGNFPESEPIGKNFILNLSKNDPRLDGEWIQTSFNTYKGLWFENRDIQYGLVDDKIEIINGDPNKGFRKNFGQIGFIYDKNLDEFIDPSSTENSRSNK